MTTRVPSTLQLFGVEESQGHLCPLKAVCIQLDLDPVRLARRRSQKLLMRKSQN